MKVENIAYDGSERRKDFLERSQFEPVRLRVDQMISLQITDVDNIREVKEFVNSYHPSSEKYVAPKQRLLERIKEYENSLEK